MLEINHPPNMNCDIVRMAVGYWDTDPVVLKQTGENSAFVDYFQKWINLHLVSSENLWQQVGVYGTESK